MRKLNDEEMLSKKIINQHKEIDQELVDLGKRIEDNKDSIDRTNDRIDELVNSDICDKKYAQHEVATVDQLQVNDKAIVEDLEVTQNIVVGGAITSDDITANKGTINELDASIISAEDITSTNINADTIYSEKLESKDIETETITAQTGSFEKLDLNTAIIENFDVAHVLAEDVKAEAVIADEVTGKKATLSELASDIIRADIARLNDLQSHNLTYENKPDDPFYIHIEPQDQPSATDYRILEVPFFDTGDYLLSLHDPDTDMGWWSVIVRNNQSNLVVSYSRRTEDLDGKPLTNPTLSEFYIYDFDGQSPRLYIKTYVGGNLYWQNQSMRIRPEVTMYTEYPFDISSEHALKYLCLHTAATWFTHHVDIGANQSLGNASLFLIPSDWNNATKEQIEYNTERDIPYRYYLPDQSLDTTDEVTFANLIIEPLDGKWVYNVENALKGHDPVRIKAGEYGTQTFDDDGKPEPVVGDKEAGQLNAFPWVVETEDLARWSGKTGTREDTINTIDGTIYRNDAFTKVDEFTYRRTSFDDYDVADYETSTTVNNVLVVQRKKDTERGKKYDLCVSDPYIKSTYEDPDLQVWDQYLYVFSNEYPTRTMFVKWIERTLNNGQVVSKILESTIDSEEYITKIVQFKDPFTTGTVQLHNYSFDNYHKPIKYVGDVVEGRWKAGEVHSIKKNVDPLSDDYTGKDYDYTGELTADGKTKLRDSVEIINDYNASDVKPVESVEITTDSKTDVIVKELNVNIGKEDDLADITITTNAETKVTNRGPIDVKNTGNITVETDGNVDVTVNGNINEEYMGKKTSRGPSEIAVHEKDDNPRGNADWYNQVIENTEIGSNEEKRDLKVNGKIYADEIVASNVGDLNVEENRLLYYQDSNFQPLSYSFAGPKFRYPTKSVSDGSFVYMPDWDGVSPLIDVTDYVLPFNPNAEDETLQVKFSNYAENLEFELPENSREIVVTGTLKYYDHGSDWTDGYFLPIQISSRWKFAIIRGGASIPDSQGMPIDVRLDNVVVRKLNDDLSNDLYIKLYEELPDGVEVGTPVEWTSVSGTTFMFDTSKLVKQGEEQEEEAEEGEQEEGEEEDVGDNI